MSERERFSGAMVPISGLAFKVKVRLGPVHREVILPKSQVTIIREQTAFEEAIFEVPAWLAKKSIYQEDSEDEE